MLNAISGGGSYLSAQGSRMRNQTESLFDNLDVNKDGSLDQNELKTFVDEMSERTGSSMGVYDIISQLDTSGNGSLGQEEFDAGRPQGPPLNGVQSLFGKIDTNADGSLDKAEINAFVQSMSDTTGNSPTAEDLISKLDADGNGQISQKEFDAGRPEGPSPHGTGGHHGHMGMPDNGEDTGSSSDLDPLDTNGDGVVDAQEAAAAGLSLLTQNYMGLINIMLGTKEDNQSLVNLSA
jgi:Ca2+-binding EF-hand superfamily protein